MRTVRWLGIYRKMHIPDDPLYFEKFYFTPGDLGFQNFETRYSRIGVLVCWDQWYPEGARITSLQGANVLFYPTAIGWHPSEKAQYGEAQLDAWRTIQRAHAIANGIFVAAVNRTGFEGPPENGLEFWGNSFVADPFGRVLAQAPADGNKCWWSNAIRSRWTKFGAIGRSCATGGSTPMRRSRSVGSAERMQAREPPASLGFRMPAEWEPHEATWLAWPHEVTRLAGQVRAHPVGIWRDRSPPVESRESSHPG